MVNKWRVDYYTHKNDVIFQNQATMANVRLSNKSIHKIQAHSRGAEQLPDTISNPDEIYSRWKDPKTQRIVLRSYIRGKYVVLTQDGEITDALMVRSTDKYRVGCLVIL